MEIKLKEESKSENNKNKNRILETNEYGKFKNI